MTTNARQEELLALNSKHKDLCKIDTASNGYTTIVDFMTAVLEDTRLRIVRGSPECKSGIRSFYSPDRCADKAAPALDNWTIDEGNEYVVSRSEGEDSDLTMTRSPLTSTLKIPGSVTANSIPHLAPLQRELPLARLMEVLR